MDLVGRCWRGAARRFDAIARELERATGWLVLHPGRYGEKWHARFRRLYPPGPNPLLLFGLNPGPYGMAQTGVPFTDLKRLQSHLPELRDELLAAREPLSLPGLAPPELRPHLTRTFESSAVRIYRFLTQAFGSPAAGYREIVAVNPCPLLFVDRKSGANLTPEDLPRVLNARGAKPLLARFDDLRRETVMEAVRELDPRGAILLGRNVAKAVGEELRAELGETRVVEWEHPARAPPEPWSKGLADELARRGLIRRARHAKATLAKRST